MTFNPHLFLSSVSIQWNSDNHKCINSKIFFVFSQFTLPFLLLSSWFIVSLILVSLNFVYLTLDYLIIMYLTIVIILLRLLSVSSSPSLHVSSRNDTCLDWAQPATSIQSCCLLVISRSATRLWRVYVPRPIGQVCALYPIDLIYF